MRFVCVGLLLLFVIEINAESVWLKDLISPKGWDLGYGVSLKLNESKKGKNVPINERLSLDLNFGDAVGVSLGNPKSDGVELDLYVKKDLNKQVEGRSKKGGHGGKNMLQMMIGYKAAMMISIMFAVLKVLTMKAIFLAKAALIISLTVLLFKLKDYRPPEIIEVEQHGYPSQSHIVEQGYGHHIGYDHHGYGGYYGNHGYGREAQPSNVYNDIVYAPSAAATDSEASGAYAAVMPNGSVVQAVNARSGQEMEKRKDRGSHKKLKSSGRSNVLSIRKYPTSSER